ncbi:uncharacterized protein LOC120266985 isoform X2 [Dioscorea cayenensis subsp. rotundata]|uniref:Uncharacterized protein LOC120266985 isoform X2 n=1 Tax=Dioscorea cayennensis subsp. rotundata TaxID=55577 RepID=A0AB40BT62_DIOCR|nr:uncharacterized protein LOC120266985 isoform X2 [Dioscorea cayenensis subsp. rotundata]
MAFYRTRNASRIVKHDDVETLSYCKNFSNVKDLLMTGLLEGLSVNYIFKKHKVNLHGFIKGDGYQCGCSSCNYTQVLSALEFEKHARVTSSHQNNHIFLDNGKTLHQIVVHLAQVPAKSLYEEMIDITGHDIDFGLFSAWMRGSLQTTSLLRARINNLKLNSPPNLMSQIQPLVRNELKRPRKKLRRGASSRTIPATNGSWSVSGVSKNVLPVPSETKDPSVLGPSGDETYTSKGSGLESPPSHNDLLVPLVTKFSSPLVFYGETDTRNCPGLDSQPSTNSMLLPLETKNPSSLVFHSKTDTSNGLGIESLPFDSGFLMHLETNDLFPLDLNGETATGIFHTDGLVFELPSSNNDGNPIQKSDNQGYGPNGFSHQEFEMNVAPSGTGFEKVQAEILEKCQEDFLPSNKKEWKSYNNVSSMVFIRNVKSLLSTGLLEGMPVKYIYKKGNVELHGYVKGLGYQCGCSSCNYTEVLSALEFERHAGAATKNQNDHIFLDCGISIYGLVKKVHNLPLDSVCGVLERMIGHPPNAECYEAWREAQAIGPQTQSSGLKRKENNQNHSSSHLGSGLVQSHVVHSIGDNDRSSFPNFIEQLLHSEQDYPIMIKEQRSSQVPNMEERVSIPFDLNEECSLMFHDIEGKEWPPSNNFGDISYDLPDYPNMINNTSSSGLPTECNAVAASSGEELNFTMPATKASTASDSRIPNANSPVKQNHSDMERSEITERLPLSQNVHNIPESTLCPTGETNFAQGFSKKRYNDLHGLVFMESGLADGSELDYRSKGQTILRGKKLQNGILCSCCNSKVSPSQFEAHAGFSGRRQPYHNIYTPIMDLSLHELSIILSGGQNLTTMLSEEKCAICGDGGELIPCDACPKAFHTVCLDIQCLPEGEWRCPYCTESFSETTSTVTASCATQPLSVHSKRILKAPTNFLGGCAFCKGFSSCQDNFSAETVLFCYQCVKEYHVGCLKKQRFCDLKDIPLSKWFCSAECDRIHVALERFVLKGPLAVPWSLITMMKSKTRDIGLANETRDEVQWQLLNGQHIPVSEKLFVKAISIFEDEFGPIVERGNDIIPAMVYSREIVDQDFEGMHCAVLMVKSVAVSAAVFRVFGKDAAEVPLIATHHKSRGKGYCKTLLLLIEELLRSLGVETVMLPAAEDELPLFLDKLGYTKMEEEQLKQYSEALPLLMFQNTSMLEKQLSRNAFPSCPMNS